MAKRIAIIGNGVAATSAIRELQSQDADLKIDVSTDERHPYYPRPHLIDYVRGTRTEEEVIKYDVDWYEDQDVSLHLSSPAHKIRTDKMSLEAGEREIEGFDQFLLSVGCVPFIPPIKGIEKKQVHVLRTLDDAIDIKEAVKGAGREIVVGGGILGIELAAAIKAVGGDPIIITNIDTLLPVQLDSGASSILRDHLEKMGISVYLGFTVQGIAGDENAEGVVSSVGDTISGDLVIVATGVRSNTNLARQSGLQVKRGVDVDDYMQTSVKNIFAAGDCAEWNNTWYGIIPWALITSRIAARNMVNLGSAKFEGITPSNTLQVAGIDLTSIGLIHVQSPEFESIVSVDRQAGTYYKAVVKDNQVVGGISLGNRKVAMKLRGLISRGTDVLDTKKTVFDDA